MKLSGLICSKVGGAVGVSKMNTCSLHVLTELKKEEMSGKAKRHGLKQKNSLTDQILGTEQDRVAPSKRKSKNKKKDDIEGVTFISEKTSKKILQEAKLQQDELEEEYGIRATRGHGGSLTMDRANSDDGDSEQEYEEDGDHDGYCPIVNEEDEKAMMKFMSKNQPERRTLADIILEKLKEKETEIATIIGGSCEPSLTKMDDRVASIFKGVGVILSKYRSGKLPKAFKAIPSLSNWEEALYLTEPDKWTAAAMWQATRVFASNLNSLKAQRFFSLVLLPRVRDDITEYKRLNYHLYSALKKALYKPAAFFKGILLPLCESGTCTLREALIISSVIAKTSIPVLHSSAALLKIAEMDYTGGNSIFLRTLFEKKYALPYRVIDASVCHYLRFADDPRRLPVLWHQSLLSFVQRYKEDLSLQQKKELLELIHVKSHSEITPEIRREIVHSKCRDGREPMEE